MRKFAIACAALAAALSLGSARADETVRPSTVNDYTPAQKDRALAAARTAGFADARVTMAQAGDLFLKADKGGMVYYLTVTPQGRVYPSTPVPMGAAG